ncbi:MAG: LysM peptidoglycan-binding domain-containing protein [Gammaproteobacteria bacterium]|nr:LysM peptidoglycan-binding domain-containing protein [Gammaproteobacteria bacterium]MDH3362828.1 LysM peptidoglycan-binding domain-containing protein [Gammaproteobacteria bacterium]MDH3481598.1 LysM peptidoglycan-binding domain-containing protein [Gammaproteobacteria bacterium]
MSLSKICLNYCYRLTLITLAVTLAGCSLNPFSKDESPRAMTPVATSSQSSGSASSLEPSQSTMAAQSTYGEPVLTPINEPVPLAEGHPNEYVVKVGDTLWDIAATFLKDPWFWPEIWYVNPEIENPHLIYPGDVLGLVYIDGQPRITAVRGSAYRLSPQARVTPLSQAVNTIPYEAVAAFLTSGVILEKDQADSLPYLLETRGEHLVAAAGNEIYVRGLADDTPGARFNVIHIGDPLRDPDDNRLIGYQGLLVGEGALRRNGDPATVALTDTVREAIKGDRLLPESIDVPLNFFPRSPSMLVDGRIISVVGGVTQIGQYQVVVINRGANNGLSVGDVLSVFQTGEIVKDRIKGGKVKLPDEEAGTVMIFKTYDRISYGLVMEATEVIHVLDAVRNPLG